MYQGALFGSGTSFVIQELRDEHGGIFVDGMVATGKRLLFSAPEGEINTIFLREHLVALRYALTSMGIYDYMTEHDPKSRGKKLLYHFEAADKKQLMTEKAYWEQEEQDA